MLFGTYFEWFSRRDSCPQLWCKNLLNCLRFANPADPFVVVWVCGPVFVELIFLWDEVFYVEPGQNNCKSLQVWKKYARLRKWSQNAINNIRNLDKFGSTRAKSNHMGAKAPKIETKVRPKGLKWSPKDLKWHPNGAQNERGGPQNGILRISSRTWWIFDVFLM